MVGQPIRVLIADDQNCARRGLRALLSTWPAVELVGEASNGQEAIRLVEERRPDVVLMDARMPVLDGLEATRLIKSRGQKVRVIVLTMQGVNEQDALAAGADFFLLKGFRPEELYEAIRSQPHSVAR